MRYQGKVNAPPFPAGLDWLNTEQPPRLEDFAGRLLLLDFWTLCCINCMHVLPVLRRLERRFPTELAVVGVHSAKFPHERESAAIADAVARYGVTHPVVNDALQAVWRSYAVRAWPTLMFVDPAGKVIGRIEGELGEDDGVRLVEEMLAEFRGAGLLRPAVPAATPEQGRGPAILHYPGKVLADPENYRLFIADSGNHRVLVAALDGEVQTVVGVGVEGLADGVLEGALFASPQGMALAGETLYVADTGNHVIRAVDLEAGVVETVAGTGAKGGHREEGGAGLEVALRSPWDLALVGRTLYVAMAGSHQIWALDLDTRVMQAVAGTGAEALVDGPPEAAAFAQPSGISADEDGVLYVADAETSSIRSVDMRSAHHVGTLVGAGLFDWADEDGPGGPGSVRLQHPLGAAYEGGYVYIADAYNHRIRRVGTDSLTVSTVAGEGTAGHTDGPLHAARFSEPGGLAVGDGVLYVADTNNHAIRVVDVAAGQVTTLPVDF
ncbi:MAG: thioredoxin-like domain-containing protein [Chloroflexota bacterium]